MNRVCRHCEDSARPVDRPRGLCRSCYYTPGVRDMYPVPDVPTTRRGVGNGFAERPPPEVPTAARPGTPEKLAELESRAAAELALWHPGDGRGDE